MAMLIQHIPSSTPRPDNIGFFFCLFHSRAEPSILRLSKWDHRSGEMNIALLVSVSTPLPPVYHPCYKIFFFPLSHRIPIIYFAYYYCECSPCNPPPSKQQFFFVFGSVLYKIFSYRSYFCSLDMLYVIS